jgi:hypothetical protein
MIADHGQDSSAAPEILRAKPKMLVEDAFEAAIDHRTHDLVDRAFSRQ